MKTTIIIVTMLAVCFNAQAQKPSAAAEPSWVSIQKIDYTTTSLDRDAEDGYIDLDYEKQVSLAEQSTYLRQSFRIISEAGVQNRSQVSVSFDPSFQQLIFHTVRIIRNGQVINKLDLAKIKTVHEESDLDDFIYNGSFNAILVLEDVRKGDVLDYSYTLKGFNPVFENKYCTVVGTGYYTPLYNLYFSITVPQGRSIDVKAINDTIKPRVHSVAGKTVYEWKNTHIIPLHAQDHLPSWYNPYPEIRVSEFKSWKEVNDWAVKLFPKNPPLSPGLAQKIKDIETAHAGDEGRTLAALRVVQDDIRYMGIEMGVHSHKPVSPGKVFDQRFGDCKEKSYLLCTMLQAMGIEASPVLINTYDKQSLFNFLPAAQNFDHVTVRVKLHNHYYWLDPTIAYQRGGLKDISYPDYQCGLVVTDTTAALTAIPANLNGMESVREVFTIPDITSAAHLAVTTTYTGSFADAQRDEFKNSSNYDIQQSLQKFYAFYFEKISADSLTFTDDDSTGVFTRKVYFTIKDIWESEKGTKKGEFYPFVIGSMMKKPDDRILTMPYNVNYPGKYHEEVEVNLPRDKDWDIDTSSVSVACAAFTFKMKSSYSSKKLLLSYDFEALKDNAKPAETDNYLAAIKKAGDADFELSYGADMDKKGLQQTSSANVIYVIAAIVLLVGGIVWWSQKS